MNEQVPPAARRLIIKSHLKGLKEYIEDLPCNLSAANAGSLKLYLSKIEPLYDEFEKIWIRTDIQYTAAKQINSNKEFYDLYFKHVAEARTLIEKYEKDNNIENGLNWNCYKPVETGLIMSMDALKSAIKDLQEDLKKSQSIVKTEK